MPEQRWYREPIVLLWGDFFIMTVKKIKGEIDMIEITFPDGNKKKYDKHVTPEAIAQGISPSLKKRCVAAKVNDNLVDLNRPIEEDASLRLITKKDPEALDVLRHSTAHLMAEAIKQMYPDANFGVGPAIDEGFYYDVDFRDVTLSEDDLPAIEERMQSIVDQGGKITRSVISREETLELFKDDPYKLELIRDLPEDEAISIYRQDTFTDLCRGPHVPDVSWLKHFKLLSLAGAYWRGNSDNKQLTRIYGTAFFSEKDLNNHLHLLEERKKRDHRKLGKELDLFMLSEYGPGFPFWLPNGMIIRKEIEDYWYDVHEEEGYEFIQTPIMLNKDLWEVSGHWENYRENMYTSEIDDKAFAIKPMNCPGGMLAYNRKLHSYRDFPHRVGELGLVHRHEASGALNGLFRVRAFTQDDAHIFMTKDMIVDEVAKLIDLYDRVYKVFDLDYHIELSTRPDDKFIGEVSVWDASEKALEDAIVSMGKDYKVNPGDGAFYGPKLDFKLRDSMNRIWQCGTIQLDMNLPERFDLTYIDHDGSKQRPVMLHRALFGSIERFIGILIEHYAGAFPTWLAPVQVEVIPVNLDLHSDYAKEIIGLLKEQDVRAESDFREEKLGYKIREAQTKKIPYQIVIGDNELEAGTVTYRKYGEKKQITVPAATFVSMIKEEIDTKQ